MQEKRRNSSENHQTKTAVVQIQHGLSFFYKNISGKRLHNFYIHYIRLFFRLVFKEWNEKDETISSFDLKSQPNDQYTDTHTHVMLTYKYEFILL